jgi:hypothetical protein
MLGPAFEEKTDKGRERRTSRDTHGGRTGDRELLRLSQLSIQPPVLRADHDRTFPTTQTLPSATATARG